MLDWAVSLVGVALVHQVCLTQGARWSVLLHWLLAITNSCNWLRYVTRFPCDIFGFYVAFIYLQKGIQVLERLGDGESFYLSIVVALLVFVVAYVCGELGRGSLFRHSVRVFLKDYGTPLTVVFFTGFVHIGRMRNVPLETLPTSTSFLPTVDRGWLVDFWNISVVDVFLALPFAVLLTILFWFDHNGMKSPLISPKHQFWNTYLFNSSPVSSLIAQGTEFPLTKPAGFHWDLFLLGLTTGVAGLLGLPFPNGLIPQAPFHTESLCVTTTTPTTTDDGKVHPTGPRATRVVEQRVSNLAQGLLTLGTMTGPLLVVLHLIPQGVLAGLFFIMGFQALEANGITAKLLFLARDAAVFGRPPGQSNNDQLAQLPRRRRRRVVWAFVALELVGFGATFAITQTVAAVGFPVFILALIPVRAALLPRWFDPLELAALDGPTASPFTMESVGGSYGGGGEEEDQEGEEGGGVIDAPDGSGSGNDSGETGEGGNGKGKGKGKGGLFRSDEELAELGEGFPAGMTRRRGSAIGRGEGGGEVVEMARLGANRRSSGHAGRAGV